MGDVVETRQVEVLVVFRQSRQETVLADMKGAEGGRGGGGRAHNICRD